MKRTPFLDLYEQCMETGVLPDDGLCACINSPNFLKREQKLFELLHPVQTELWELTEEDTSQQYWGSELKFKEDPKDLRWTNFGERRQNILLFCAVMNDEF